MKLSKQSWHYKLNDRLSEDFIDDSNLNLCEYFWLTVRTLFFLLSLVLVFIGFLFIAVSSLLFWQTAVTGYVFEYLLDYGILDILLFFQLLFTPLALFCGALSAFKGEMDVFPEYIKGPFRRLLGRSLEKDSKPEVRKEPSVVIEYIKAKKNKICPIIEFK